jgi:hypothetical protein
MVPLERSNLNYWNQVSSELVPKFDAAVHASHAALPMVTPKSPLNVALPMLKKNSLQ